MKNKIMLVIILMIVLMPILASANVGIIYSDWSLNGEVYTNKTFPEIEERFTKGLEIRGFDVYADTSCPGSMYAWFQTNWDKEGRIFYGEISLFEICNGFAFTIELWANATEIENIPPLRIERIMNTILRLLD